MPRPFSTGRMMVGRRIRRPYTSQSALDANGSRLPARFVRDHRSPRCGRDATLPGPGLQVPGQHPRFHLSSQPVGNAASLR